MIIEAMKQALEALERVMRPGPAVHEAITALRAAIKQVEERQWQELTEEELNAMRQESKLDFVTLREFRAVAHAVEARLKELNG